ncbi:biotin/lipoyl-containing protein, partial [Paenibacillus sp. P22]|uniref:biotin/lipoyl-containing protein n=2 Tax=Paenibacillus TaxID=44249 RepID=UPI000436097F
MSDIKVPELGESISEATITKWLKKEGEAVAQGDLLLELETDKVNLEISADSSGVLSSIVKGEGDTVLVGETIGVIGEGGAAASAPAAAPAQPVQTEA